MMEYRYEEPLIVGVTQICHTDRDTCITVHTTVLTAIVGCANIPMRNTPSSMIEYTSPVH